MEGYDETTYGDAFADVYDDWYEGISDVDSTVACLLDLAGGGPILELGVGTGRIAVPLARAGRDAGVTVTGVDASSAMLARLARRDTDALVVAVAGDMAAGIPDGPFTLAFVAYNTFFNLRDPLAQRACFTRVAERLSTGGRFVIEAFVPDDPPRHGDDVSVRSIAADRVVLSVAVHDADAQTADGHFVELVDGAPVRLRPWSIRYASPAELDEMAAAAGFGLEDRWERFDRASFGPGSTHHVSVYRKT